ncbi:hypothetical protein M422DRAFT_240490 [Sphaerobolus stellatus SS14]|nr:hypothetical protein M422DRAFT_240490 [Sphaerobolus stellatus SS14]
MLIQAYPNIRNDFSDSLAWQKYFLVKGFLTNVSFPLSPSFAGNLSVDRSGYPNNTLFFWALREKERLRPWGIWLNGGPGASSMIGLFYENGPLHISPTYGTFISNNYSRTNDLDMFWIDNPVGVGFSTADIEGYINSEDQMAEDSFGFINNLVQIFPSLRRRPLYLMGESYADIDILNEFVMAPHIMYRNVYPYIVKHYFGLEHPPVNLVKFSIGAGLPPDGLIGSDTLIADATMLSVIETYPQLIGYDTDVYNYSKEQVEVDALNALRKRGFSDDGLRDTVARAAVAIQKRDLSGRANGTIDPFFECNLAVEVISYVINFTNLGLGKPANFDRLDIPNVLNPYPPNIADITSGVGLTPFFNVELCPIIIGTNSDGDLSAPPTDFLMELTAISTKADISWVIYSGNDDFLVPHFGSQCIGHPEYNGGFTKSPATPWYGDDEKMAGIVHQERNITFTLFKDAGHLVPQWQPARTLTFLRKFIMGCSKSGTVLSDGLVIGGESAPLQNNILPAERNPIFTGSGAIMGSIVWSSATIASWDMFTATALSAPLGTAALNV